MNNTFLRSLLLSIGLLVITQYVTAQPASFGIPSATGVAAFAGGVNRNNPALISQVDSSLASLAIRPAPFGLAQLSELTVGAALRLGELWSAALAATALGNTLYNESSLRGLLAFEMSRSLTAGLSLKLQRIGFRDAAAAGALTIDFGVMMRLTDSLRFGAFFQNVNRGQYASHSRQVDQTAGWAFAYMAGPALQLEIAALLQIGGTPAFSIGTLHALATALRLRFALRSIPRTALAALELKLNDFSLIPAIQYIDDLGFSQELKLGVSF